MNLQFARIRRGYLAQCDDDSGDRAVALLSSRMVQGGLVLVGDL